MNLYKELQDKLNEHNPIDVDELILDELFEGVTQFTEQNKKDLEKYSNLVHLSLNGFGLESLKNFPKLPSLQVLEIRQNLLTGNDFKLIAELYPQLYKLKVGENPISSSDVFKPLAGSNIKKIELVDTGVSEKKDYRDTLFSFLKNVEIIDNQTREGDDASSTVYEDYEDEEGDNEGSGDEEIEGDDDDNEDVEDDDEDEIN